MRNATECGAETLDIMIRYTLKCDRNHVFDSWFRSADDFEKLELGGMISCSVCGSTNVGKAIMAPRLQAGQSDEPAAGNKHQTDRPLSSPASPAEQALKELRAKIEAISEDVGREFAREARAIHAGEAPERPIIGQTAPDEARALIEDGIPVAPLPWSGRKTN